MQALRTFNVIPKIPAELDALWYLAHNYWFAWNPEIQLLFSQISPELWENSYGNPVWFLNHVSQRRYTELVEDEHFRQRLKEAVTELREYSETQSPYKMEGLDPGHPAVAYFSLEFGVALSLPVYSGGLGILAGDHLKSASDLNVPLVGIGLNYRNGYFRQYMTPDGWQQERYPEYDFEQMPLRRATTPEGENAVVHLQVGDRPLAAQIWEASVGRIRLFLLDTNLPENPADFRQITARLYGGNIEMRIWQEILLGIGGVKALKVLGLSPRVIHMNEGHSAFAGLERVRVLMAEQGLTFEAALEVSAASSIFTTHTPVPAGNDRFSPQLMQQYFEPYARDMGLAFKVFLALGREVPQDDAEPFCMTVLALRLSRFNNGVSDLHGHVSRKMWHKIWNQFPEEDVPIGSITNGVHAPTWVAPELRLLYNRFLGGNWRDGRDSRKSWAQASAIPDSELWRAHERQRARLVDFVRGRVQNQLLANGVRAKDLQDAEDILDPEALTIGFARRFATYKRANLLFQDKESLLRIVSNKERPVQFIFAGKAHPNDNEGKQLMKEVITLSREPEFRKSVVFIEDYDMNVAAHLVSGCDVWLNNPRRPLEACGTSGMKAMLNGVLQFSSLDGWWEEAWKPDNSVGWAIGKGEEYEDAAYQDFVELQTLYKVLESEIIPDFYERERNGLPRMWIRRMKQALIELGPRYNSNRMVVDYLENAYIPAFNSYMRFCRDNFASAHELSNWRMNIMTHWGEVQLRNIAVNQEDILFVGDSVKVTCEIFSAGIPAEHLQVEIYTGRLGQNDGFVGRVLNAMTPEGPSSSDGWQKYGGFFKPEDAGRYGFNVRIMPVHPLLPNQHFGLIRWGQ